MSGYVHQTDDEVEDIGPAPHGGNGEAQYHRFFSDVDTPLYLNRVVLKPGASVGVHLQPIDEIYYVLRGRGEMRVGGEVFGVGPGSAVLTRGGHPHELRQTGADDLELIVVHAGGASRR